MLIWDASPHMGGTTDALARACASATSAQIIHLRDHLVQPCSGCNICRTAVCPHHDEAAWLFFRLQKARTNLFIGPIYFYGLPAHCKAFIDRGQIFWHQPPPPVNTPAAAILVGASNGPKLFEGSILTLKYFLHLFAIPLTEVLELREIESSADLTPDDLLAAMTLAKKMADNV